jgi:hypothetical protein
MNDDIREFVCKCLGCSMNSTLHAIQVMNRIVVIHTGNESDSNNWTGTRGDGSLVWPFWDLAATKRSWDQTQWWARWNSCRASANELDLGLPTACQVGFAIIMLLKFCYYIMFKKTGLAPIIKYFIVHISNN